MDDIVKKKLFTENESYSTQPIDASWLRLIYLAMKNKGLPTNIIFEALEINVKELNSLEYVEQSVICQLYDQVEHLGYLNDLPSAVADIFQIPFLRYSAHSPFEANTLKEMIYEMSNMASQITQLVRTKILHDGDFIQLSFSSSINEYQLNKVSIEIGINIALKIAFQIFPHINGGIANIILPRETYKEELEYINDIPVIYCNKNTYSIVFHKMLSQTKNIFAVNKVNDFSSSLSLIENRDNLNVLSNVQAIIKNHIREPELNIDFVANKINTSAKTIQRRLSSLNKNFTMLVQQHKVEQAIFLLNQSKLSIKQIAFELGFNSTSSFSRAFKSWKKLTPSNYLASSDKSKISKP